MRHAILLMGLLLLGCGGNQAPATAPEKAASPPTADDAMRATCCKQCGSASSRDPAGMDIRMKTCTSYPAEWNGGPGVDDACRGWFAAQPQPLTVGDCAQ